MLETLYKEALDRKENPKEGSYTNSDGISMVSYKITVYIGYGTNGTTSCTGIITKSKYVQ